MRAPILDELRGRLARLERQLRVWRAVGALAGVGVGALLLMGLAPSGPPVVAAQRFVVVDGHGTPRASFGLESDGSPVIRFQDKTGIGRVTIGIVDGEPEATLTSSDGTVRWKAR